MQELAPEGRVSGAGRSCFGSGRRGNGDVDGAHFTERRERGVEIIVAADGENDEPFRVHVFRRGAANVLDGHPFHALLVRRKKVPRVAVVVVRHEPAHDLALAVEVEYERVQSSVPRELELFLRHRLPADALDLFDDAEDGLDGRLGLGAARGNETPRVVVGGTPARARVVGEPSLGADRLEETRGKAASKDLRHDGQGEVVGVVDAPSEMADANLRLVDVVFLHEGDGAASLRIDGRNGIGGRLALRPGPKIPLHKGAHFGGIEVAPEPEEDPVRLEVVAMKQNEVLSGNGLDGRVLGNASVGTLRTVEKLRELAAGDLRDVVVAARDRGALLDLRELDLVLRKSGVSHQLRQDLENERKVLFQSEDRGAPRGDADLRFDGGTGVLELPIDLLAGAARGAAGAKHLPEDAREPDLLLGLEARAGANQHQPLDLRERSILEGGGREAGWEGG